MKNVEFNMSEAIRDYLAKNKRASSAEVQQHIKENHPGHVINKNSFSVAFYTTRKKLGIAGGRGKKKRAAVVRDVTIRTSVQPHTSTGALQITREMMKAAAELLRVCGDVNAALLAVRDVHSFQV